ncbi:hypothetical protein FB566_1143 [Stackebrandtia endophytica]|uniref:Uncharacterized protein n=1 Tax=Stackebrandtia endophytica TaxID=1496996 RepID=A0A543AST2_9ACTN|nr:hypothetical protein [Stackebrandtia endophytica]TQL75634.1 hypothetical protein FB566_1143 [Stackebrandtia endophytica]
MTRSLEGKLTLGSQRSVLAVARNGASAFRLLEVVKLFDDDDRLNLRMTVGPDSGYGYGYGVEQLLTSQRVRLLPWDSATAMPFDLVISGSANTCLSEVDGPVVLFPHGAGHHKRPPAASTGGRVHELTEEQLLYNGSVIAAKHLLPGRDSMIRLKRDCEPASRRAVIAGDPIAQQIREHIPLRETYRAALGVTGGQKLIVVTSTWGPNSFAARSLGMLKQLVAELPFDEYRVVATFHHNVTIRDGHRELERILKSAIDSGLILLPPTLSWQAALIAADGVLGDQGSATFYAADIAPVAVAVNANSDCPPDSPMTALIDALPHIETDQPLLPQVEALVAKPRSDDIATIIDASVKRDIDSAAEFRSTMYRLMDLDEPDVPAFLPLAVPRPESVEVTAFVVSTMVVEDHDGLTVELTRYPAATARMAEGRHLVVRTDDPDPRRAQTAAALVAANPEPDLTDLLDRFPGCRVAAKPLPSGEVSLLVQDGSEYTVATTPAADGDTAALVASTYLSLARARRLDSSVLVRSGARRILMDFGVSARG